LQQAAAHAMMTRYMNTEFPGPGSKLPSGRHDLPRDVVVQSQRDRIMVGIAEVLSENGYAETTVTQICERAGVSSATFYELFRGKDDCLMAAAQTLLGEMITIVTGQYSADKPIYTVIRDAIAAVLALMAQRPAFAHLIFIGGRTSTPAVTQIYNSGVTALVSLLDQVRVDGPPDSESPASSARAAVGSLEMLIRNEILAGRSEQLQKVLPEATYGALVAFLGQEQALSLAAEARENPPQIELMPYGRAHL
jgi:AcrR family transcriptional regulator